MAADVLAGIVFLTVVGCLLGALIAVLCNIGDIFKDEG